MFKDIKNREKTLFPRPLLYLYGYRVCILIEIKLYPSGNISIFSDVGI